MMTGQILSGISPIIAVKYQIMVMCIILASGGLSTAVYLKLLEKKTLNGDQENITYNYNLLKKEEKND